MKNIEASLCAGSSLPRALLAGIERSLGPIDASVVIVDALGNWLEVSNNCEEVLGVGRESLLGDRFYHLLNPDWAHEMKVWSFAFSSRVEVSRAILGSGERPVLETEIHLRPIQSGDTTGTLFAGIVSVRFGAKPKTVKCFVPKRFHGCFSLDGRPLELFGDWEDIMSVPLQILTESMVQDYFPAPLQHEIHGCLASCRSENGAFSFKSAFRSGDGSQVPVELTFTPSASSQNVLLSGVTINAAVDDSKNQDYLFSIASHELNNPLTVLSITAMMMGEGQPSTEMLQHAEVISRTVDRMKSTLKDLVLLSSIASPDRKIEMVEIDLPTWVSDTARDALGECPRERKIEFSGFDRVLPITTCPNLLSHALLNAIGNALKYSPETSKVEISLSAADDCVTVSVRDRGIGIPEAELPRVFAAFHRCSNTGKIPGTGLGLLIAKRSAEKLGVQLEIKSSEGQGTTFLLHIPTKSPRSIDQC